MIKRMMSSQRREKVRAIASGWVGEVLGTCYGYDSTFRTRIGENWMLEM
jgi:hypothetical protein